MISLYKNNFELHAEGAGEVRQRGETPLSLEDEGHTKIGCERHPKWVGKCISNHPTSRCAPGDLALPRLPEQRPPESSLWALAYECFQKEDPKLAQKFGDCLGIDPVDLNAGLDQVIQKALEKIKETQDSKDILYKTPLGRYLKKAVEIIIASKDFIGSAVSAEPHAALACCGVSLLLPVSIPDVVTNIEYL